MANPGHDWHAFAARDFNGDGKADILWQNDDGASAIWELNGTSIIGAAPVGPALPTWHVAGTGDFNGDGRSDILWQTDNYTQLAIWEMNGTSIIGAAFLPDPGPTWILAGTGDFNGDGKTDIIWQNIDGTSAIWEMNGTSIIGSRGSTDPWTGLEHRGDRRLQRRRQGRYSLAELQ